MKIISIQIGEVYSAGPISQVSGSATKHWINFILIQITEVYSIRSISQKSIVQLQPLPKLIMKTLVESNIASSTITMLHKTWVHVSLLPFELKAKPCTISIYQLTQIYFAKN